MAFYMFVVVTRPVIRTLPRSLRIRRLAMSVFFAIIKPPLCLHDKLHRRLSSITPLAASLLYCGAPAIWRMLYSDQRKVRLFFDAFPPQYGKYDSFPPMDKMIPYYYTLIGQRSVSPLKSPQLYTCKAAVRPLIISKLLKPFRYHKSCFICLITTYIPLFLYHTKKERCLSTETLTSKFLRLWRHGPKTRSVKLFSNLVGRRIL